LTYFLAEIFVGQLHTTWYLQNGAGRLNYLYLSSATSQIPLRCGQLLPDELT